MAWRATVLEHELGGGNAQCPSGGGSEAPHQRDKRVSGRAGKCADPPEAEGKSLTGKDGKDPCTGGLNARAEQKSKKREWGSECKLGAKTVWG